ncbi:lipase 1-like isoform X1 [Zophobas morio]|uniref:lipase 1-like isoform X1 n=1 Tax=Zophobas morio TaxID=2755281 RepID=UPI003082D00E
MFRSILYISVLTAFSIIVIEVWNKSKHKHPYVGLNVEQIIQRYEYPAEVHHVTTEDGYILTLHRIPHGRENHSLNRTSILLLPGILQTAWDYVHYGPHKCLSFLLAEKGYDVWLGNFRGTAWSRKHAVLNPDQDSSYWNFTFVYTHGYLQGLNIALFRVHEMGIYDVPAFIDHIVKFTNKHSLHYVGFSQATIAFTIMGSERSEYLSRVKLFTALGPAVLIGNPISPLLKFLVKNQDSIKTFLRFFNYREILKQGDPFRTYLEHICNENSIFANLCLQHLFIMLGYNYDEMPMEMLSLTSSHFPSGTSLTNIEHVFQMICSGNFSKYDYGIQGNKKKYDQEKPPLYNLSKLTVPTALYYSSNDWAVNIANVEKLIKVLPNVVKTYKVPSDKFNHYDFLAAKNVVRLLYSAVIDEILKY